MILYEYIPAKYLGIYIIWLLIYISQIPLELLNGKVFNKYQLAISLRIVQIMRHVNLVTIAGTTILVPFHIVKGPRLGYPGILSMGADPQLVAATWINGMTPVAPFTNMV